MILLRKDSVAIISKANEPALKFLPLLEIIKKSKTYLRSSIKFVQKMKNTETAARKPPLKKDSISMQMKENKIKQVSYVRSRVYVEISGRKDESFSSYKGLSPTSNRSTDSISRASSRESKRSSSRDR